MIARNGFFGRWLAAAAILIAACGSGPATSRAPAAVPDSGDPLRGGKACASSADCRAGFHCTTDDGVCNPPPGCRPGSVCPAVCFGTCAPSPRVTCGPTLCPQGQACCNESCGLCAPPDGGCTQQVCAPAAECRTDADCRAFSDYCTGCDCRALSVCEPDPVCPTAGVQCFVDPCEGQEAACVDGRCALRAARPACPERACGPALGMPNTLCPDGVNVAGPTGRCLGSENGTCGWEIRDCPDPSVCAPAPAAAR